MKQITIQTEVPSKMSYDQVVDVNSDIHILSKDPYAQYDGEVFLLDENANILDKNADSYPSGTIKAFGFKAGDGNYYAVDVEPDGDAWYYWGGYGKLVNNVLISGILTEAQEDYAGESNTLEIINQLKDYNDGLTTGAPAAEACRTRFLNGKPGFLPALGQLRDFYNHNNEVSLLISKFSLESLILFIEGWSSTQYSQSYSWYRDSRVQGGANRESRISQRNVLTFFAL